MLGRAAMRDCAVSSLPQSTRLLTKRPHGLGEALESGKIFSSGDKVVKQIDTAPVLAELTFQWRGRHTSRHFFKGELEVMSVECPGL